MNVRMKNHFVPQDISISYIINYAIGTLITYKLPSESRRSTLSILGASRQLL